MNDEMEKLFSRLDKVFEKQEFGRKREAIYRLAAALVRANEYAGMEAVAEAAIVLYEHIETKMRVLDPLSQKSYPAGHILAKDRNV
jgi:hypothetical protein